ncbi:unnamed protein product [Moneuplotes crassus]|uniref:Uncharacterized protein n=1 Tax=Euplotes crassus TaxID=5936 RepID=A0AAD1U4L3_EUPCR|nr:unnamed protein product [Moneuplotes crassus]
MLPKNKSNKEILSRLEEIGSIVRKYSSGGPRYSRTSHSEDFPGLLKELIGDPEKAESGLISQYGQNEIDSNSGSIVKQLDDILLPKSGLFSYAWKSNEDSSLRFNFPIVNLPKHAQTLIERKMFDNLPDLYSCLAYPIQEQIKNIVTDQCLVLSSFEYLLFCFFTKISRIDSKDDGTKLVLSTLGFNVLDRPRYELHLFSKYYLYLFHQAAYGKQFNVTLYTQLVIEYFLNPVVLVDMINSSIDEANEQYASSNRYRFGAPGGNQPKLTPFKITEEPRTIQMLFIHVSVMIIKDQWKPYLLPTLHNTKYDVEENPAIMIMRSMHKWFKTLLTHRADLINNKGKMFNLCCVYLTIVATEESNDDAFSLMMSTRKPKSSRTGYFRITSSYTNDYSDEEYDDELILDKFHRGGGMDQDSLNEWIKTFLVLYTDTFRDFVTFIADEDNISGLDYLAIYELSELFKVEAKRTLNGAIQLEVLTKISRSNSSKSECREYQAYIQLMHASPEWIDPFSYDRHFKSKIDRVIDHIGARYPVSVTGFPNSVSGSLAENVLETIKQNINRTIDNFISIAKSSNIDRNKDYNGSYKVTPFEVVEESTFKRSTRSKESGKSKKNPYNKNKKDVDYYSDWRKPQGKKENLILYLIFFYLSMIVDRVIYRDQDPSKFEYPKTNLRFMAKPLNFLALAITVGIFYYICF